MTIPSSLQLGLKSVVDQTSYQPTQGDAPLLGDFAKVAEEIIGQDNVDLRIGVRCDPPSVVSRRHSDAIQITDQVR